MFIPPFTGVKRDSFLVSVKMIHVNITVMSEKDQVELSPSVHRDPIFTVYL